MTPTPRAAYALLAVALLALAVPAAVVARSGRVVVVATIVDVVLAHHRLRVRRTMPRTLSRGVAAPLLVETDAAAPGRVEIRQAQPADVEIEPSVGRGALDAHVDRAPAGRRGAAAGHGPRAAARSGSGGARSPARARRSSWCIPTSWPRSGSSSRCGAASSAIPGSARSGPLGLGTDFESIRDYLPDDDVRQINWTATERVGRPMSNVYRIEQDRDVVCLLDAGRLMSAPLDARTTRLDAAVDAVTMVALVADELGDRCGVTVFDAAIRSQLRPRRNGGRAVVRAILDAEPTPGRQRLRPRVPHVERRQAVAHPRVHRSRRRVGRPFTRRGRAGADPPARGDRRVGARPRSRRRAPAASPTTPHDVYAAAVAVDVLDERQRVAARLEHAGARVVEAPPAALGEACVRAYLRLKARARL